MKLRESILMAFSFDFLTLLPTSIQKPGRDVFRNILDMFQKRDKFFFFCNNEDIPFWMGIEGICHAILTFHV
jgi:hypothetical protein